MGSIPTSTTMITITDIAANKAKEIAKAEDIENTILRMRVIGGGCAGFQHDLYFEDKDKITDMDETFEVKEITIVIDPLSFQYLDGTDLDYVVEEFASGFKFINPNVSNSCGCGSSVAF